MRYNEIDFWWTETEVFIYKNGVLWQHGGKPWIRACSCCATPELKNEWKERGIQLGGTVSDELMNGFPGEEEWITIEEMAENERVNGKASFEENQKKEEEKKRKEKIRQTAVELLYKYRFADATIYCKIFHLDFEKLIAEIFPSTTT